MAFTPRRKRFVGQTNCDTNQRVYHRITHGIGIENPQPRANSRVRHSIPNPVALNATSRRVPLTLRQIHRIHAVMTHAQPMMVMTDKDVSRFQPR